MHIGKILKTIPLTKVVGRCGKVSHRQYYTGFYFNDPNKQVYENSSYIRNYDIVGVVKSYDEETKIATIEQRNKALKVKKLRF